MAWKLPTWNISALDVNDVSEVVVIHREAAQSGDVVRCRVIIVMVHAVRYCEAALVQVELFCFQVHVIVENLQTLFHFGRQLFAC